MHAIQHQGLLLLLHACKVFRGSVYREDLWSILYKKFSLCRLCTHATPNASPTAVLHAHMFPATVNIGLSARFLKDEQLLTMQQHHQCYSNCFMAPALELLERGLTGLLQCAG